MVNYVTAPDQLIPKCLEILEKIKTKSPKAVGSALNAMNAYFSEGVDGFEKEIEELRRELKIGLDQIERGQTVPASEVFRILRERADQRDSSHS